MLNRIRQLLSDGDEVGKADAPAIPEGRRVYAIGDIHGRNDLFKTILARIEEDDSQREPAETTIVLLGDLVDRGPDSAGVVKAARKLAKRRDVRVLMGNHEEMFLRALDDTKALRQFLRVGGRETVLSYGIDKQTYRKLELKELRALLNDKVPGKDIRFLKAMEDHVLIGDYLFVHAGIRPGKDIEKQRTADLRWIREPFLSHAQPHGPCVIHGHTIRRKIDSFPSKKAPVRIGIDTGAYETDKLTAIGLQRGERWFMDTAD